MPTPPRLPNGQPIKERINVYGLTDTGKTHQYFMIAKWHHDLGSDARFYAVNTDTSFEVLVFNPEFSDLTNIEWVDATTFDEFYQGTKQYVNKMRDQDWLALDLMDDAWALVQDEYTRLRAREQGIDLDNIGELYLESGQTKKYPVEGWDWQTPNARYRALANNYVLRGPGHRFIISRQADIIQPSAGMKEDPQTKANRVTFEPIGVKPGGQKEDPSRWHTILHLSKRGERQQAIATAKERFGVRRRMGTEMGNGQIRPEKLDDFFMDYLVGVAGWSLE